MNSQSVNSQSTTQQRPMTRSRGRNSGTPRVDWSMLLNLPNSTKRAKRTTTSASRARGASRSRARNASGRAARLQRLNPVVRAERYATRQAARSLPPPPQPIVNTGLTLTLYEGRSVLQLEKQLNSLQELCRTYDTRGEVAYEIQLDYLKNHFSNQGHSYALFAILAMSGGRPVGYVKCKVWNKHENMRRTRMVVIDLLCAMGRQKTKGVGSVLLDEVERYARDELGASMLILYSVEDPATVRWYRSKGFLRTLDPCEPLSNASNINARQAYRALPTTVTRTYRSALNRKYFEKFNDLGDTVVMTKCLRSSPTLPRRVVYSNKNKHARFRRNDTKTMALYRLVNGKWGARWPPHNA